MRPGNATSPLGNITASFRVNSVTVKRLIMSSYPDISDPGLISDLQTAALVTTDGTIDWFCRPRFDPQRVRVPIARRTGTIT